MRNVPLAGALITGEKEEEVVFLLKELKQWLPKHVSFMTIDFSSRLQAGVDKIFPDALLQKCVFHAIQLLTRGLLKEFSRIKKLHLTTHIAEWNALRKDSLHVEKEGTFLANAPFSFPDVEHSRQIQRALKKCISHPKPEHVKKVLLRLFSSPLFTTWKGHQAFLANYQAFLHAQKLKFSEKGMPYIRAFLYKQFRSAIRSLRKVVEETKAHFNQAKYLLLMNPVNMTAWHHAQLRACLKEFPWLRPYRRILVKFYYQFRLPPEKRSSLRFLLGLIEPDSHSWLHSAVSTLISNEENVFRFQQFHELFPKRTFSPSIKVVNESSNKLMNNLYQTQCGMRTLENIRMRVSHRLGCPVIVSPAMLEKLQ